mgnify:CR=1 FL=1
MLVLVFLGLALQQQKNSISNTLFHFSLVQVSDKMEPSELVKACELLNPSNKPGRLTVIVRMGAEKVREKLPHLIRAIRQSGFIVTWVSDPMHGNTIRAPSGLKTRPFDLIRVMYYVFDVTLENAKF